MRHHWLHWEDLLFSKGPWLDISLFNSINKYCSIISLDYLIYHHHHRHSVWTNQFLKNYDLKVQLDTNQLTDGWLIVWHESESAGYYSVLFTGVVNRIQQEYFTPRFCRSRLTEVTSHSTGQSSTEFTIRIYSVCWRWWRWWVCSVYQFKTKDWEEDKGRS